MDRDQVGLILDALGVPNGPGDGRAEAKRSLWPHGDFVTGFVRPDLLSEIEVSATVLDADTPQTELGAGGPSLAELEQAVRVIGPWKKGPFLLSKAGQGGVSIDAEWRSDLKWRRVLQLGASFSGQRVLDVGTGNGYFLLRLLGAGAAVAAGLEPTVRSLLQFMVIRALFGAPNCWLWPLRLQEFPPPSPGYDTVMSMGVLYHQRDPIEHLQRLRCLLAPGGELILESIVLDASLRIEKGGRYAGMRNVYTIPSVRELESWLDQAGFEILALGAAQQTTGAEQRATDFASGPSLDDVLEPAVDPDDPERRTREGHPRPARLALRAAVKQALR